MANKMLIDATHPEETRVVVVRGNRVEEFDFESANRRQLRGNIYLAKVTRVEPSLQAAFIEYGGNRHGFLAFSEIHPDYYQIPVADRQALIDEEERAHRAAEDEADRRAGRGNGQPHGHANDHGHEQRSQAAEASQSVRRSEPLDHDETGGRGEGEHHAAEQHGDEHHDVQRTGGEHTHDAADGAAPPAHADAPAASLPPAESPASSEAAPPYGEPADTAAGTQPQADMFGGDDNTDGGVPFASSQPPSEEGSAFETRAPFEAGEHASFQPHDDTQGTPEAGAEDAALSEAARADKPHDRDHEAQAGGEAPQRERHGRRPRRDNRRRSESSSNGFGEDDSEIEEVGSEEEDVVESVGGADALEEVQERTPRYRKQYKIQEVIKRRQVMLVQVVKEERGTKGAALTTYLSLAGRYSVLMPNTARGGGISRKITNSVDRRRLKEIAGDLEVPEGMGVILRTAGANRTKPEVNRDFEYLLRLWETVRDLTLKSSAPTLVYEEGSLIKRAIRDLYNKDIDEVVAAGDDGFREARDFMRMLMPSHAKNVKPFNEAQPIFTRYGIESQLDAMFSPVVQLRSGGYIVINQTEALVAIDVNSGRATREHHIEDTALKTNLEASEEVARQLRLRDLAGLVVIDFIDMEEKRNNRAVERKLKECLKHDRARIQVGRISHFGLLEMSRQRLRSSVLESSTEKCEHCGGTGHVRSVSSVTLQLLRAIEEMLLKGGTHNLIGRTRADIALYVLNHKRAHLRELETRFQLAITISADAAVNGQQPFLIERGEQAHSIEAARVIAQQQPAIATSLIDDDYDLDDGEDEAVADEAAEENGEAESDTETGVEADAEGEDGGQRRRRRRRRSRGGRSGEPSEPGEATPGESRRDGEPVSADAHSSSTGESEPGVPGEDGAEAPGDDATRRRRRRGRRGGRRNPAGGTEGEPIAAEAGSDPQAGTETIGGWQDWADGPQGDAVAAQLPRPETSAGHDAIHQPANDESARGRGSE